MNNRATNIIAICLLLFVFLIAVFSMKGDSLTMDELAHLPAGYSYLTQKDMRLNPEHPPLLKDLSAIPLLFIKGINFPKEAKDWKEDINGQWGFGNIFLFKSGNPADKMIFWGRIPMILVLIILGIYLFRWTKELFGNKAGLLALFLFSFSPTFLAHGRLVTTDVGAAAGAFIATYYFVKFLKDNSKKNLLKAGIVFGLAELAKFSLILLIPLFGILVLCWALVKSANFKLFLKNFFRHLGFFLLIIIIGYILVWLVYAYHTWNYPAEKQLSDAQFILTSTRFKSLAKLVFWAMEKPILRPLAQYFLGLFMVFQRATGGNTAYFLGEVSAAGWKTYFPVVYSIKEPLAFYVLTLTAILYLAWLIKKPPHQKLRFGAGPVQHRALLWCWAFWQNTWRRLIFWIKAHFAEFSMLLFIFIYWFTSLTSDLNIGVRHLLPVFPFTISLASGVILIWLKPPRLLIKTGFLFLLLFWQALSVILVYPHFLAYFNELVGGPNEGYKYAVDSNLDWGQDLKRLKKWQDKNSIDKIYVDYFGGADVEYYLKEKYAPWQGTRNPEELPKKSYLAVSATFLQGGRGLPVPGFDQPKGFYQWLNDYTPLAKIGYSIFVYKID